MKYQYGSIISTASIKEYAAYQEPLSFQGLSSDKALLPKKADIPFMINQSVCRFSDTGAIYIYNESDDRWYNSNDPSDYV